MKKILFPFLLAISFSCVADGYSQNFLKCSKNNNGSTDEILNCINDEYKIQKKEINEIVNKNNIQNSSVTKKMQEYSKKIDKQISDKCSVFYYLDGDRGSILEGQCELDELISNAG